MPADPRKRQKSLEKKAARRKEKKHMIVREETRPVGAQFALAVQFPVLHSWVSESCWENGIGWALFSREFPDGRVAAALFLVDNYCLGVKNVILSVTNRSTYNIQVAQKMRSNGPVREFTPESFRKFVEGAVAYAQDLGLAPHKDYQAARVLFGDIDPARSTETFEYGKDGKPLFINGPNDSPARIREVMAALARKAGPGNYDFLVAGPVEKRIIEE